MLHFFQKESPLYPSDQHLADNKLLKKQFLNAENLSLLVTFVFFFKYKKPMNRQRLALLCYLCILSSKIEGEERENLQA